VVESLITSVSGDSIRIDEKVIALADELVGECNVKDFMDALHIASACFVNALYFITCDDELIDNSSKIENFLKSRGYVIYQESHNIYRRDRCNRMKTVIAEDILNDGVHVLV